MKENDWLDADRAHANGAFIAGSEAYPDRWAKHAAGFRDALGARALTGIPYGAGERERLDLFLPESTPRGLLVFIHGGYWLAFGRESWSHLAAGALARGFACAIPSYTLAPEASIAQMTAQVAQSIRTAAAAVAGPIVVTGHSAGGHLAARMACADGPHGVVRSIPISPLSELSPLMATTMNAKLKIDDAVAAAESPARLARRVGVEAHVWVGAAERPSFLWQARVLSEAWNCAWTAEPGRHHFDVIEGLSNGSSALVETCLGGL